MSAVPECPTCIVCYEETEGTQTGLADWHHCRQCTAMWCDTCMEAMYNKVRDDEEMDEELKCPQCRKPVADMQLEARVARILDFFNCSEADSSKLLMYEGLLSELVHVCESLEDGMPYYTLPRQVAARALSRESSMCDVVREAEGTSAGTRLGRMLRGGEYAGATVLVIRGYANALRSSVRPPAPSSNWIVPIEELLEHLRADVSWGSTAEAQQLTECRATLRECAEKIVDEAGRGAEQRANTSASGGGSSSQSSGPSRGSRKRRR